MIATGFAVPVAAVDVVDGRARQGAQESTRFQAPV